MRKVVYSLLANDITFTELMPRLYERSAVPDSPVLPFALYAFTESPRRGRAYPQVPRLELWCYEERGDYATINEALAIADSLFLSVTHMVVEGEHIAEATPQGWSGDLYDDVFRANTRNAGYLLVGTGG